MVAPISDEKKREAIRLRVAERLSLEAIAKRIGVSKGTVSEILRDYPLSDAELHERRARGFKNLNKNRGRYTPILSKLAQLVGDRKLGTDQKGQVAEAAVLLRLRALGYKVLHPPENSRADFVVSNIELTKFVRVQVKWAKRAEEGRPYVSLLNGESKKIRPVTRQSCDFVVGYDMETDTAFVMPIEEIEGITHKTCDEKYSEAWYLLGI